MILLIHSKAKKVVRVIYQEKKIDLNTSNISKAFWELAQKYPKELIYWIEEKFVDVADFSNWKTIFHHDLIMASYAVENAFLPPALGYTDQSPFINVNRRVSFGTWQMSSDIGGVKAAVLLKFKRDFSEIENFPYLLNSIAKVGQQNGLFCYSEPALVKSAPQENPQYAATTSQLFSFVFQHYKTAWVYLLFRCFFKYENSSPFIAFSQSFFDKKYFQHKVDLSGFQINSTKDVSKENSVDVVIPTMGRAPHLLQVLDDLKNQTMLPVKVIVVEQNAELNSVTELPELSEKEWPFEIVHHFIHQTGACNARNIALEEVSSEWVFLLDDDVRLGKNILQSLMDENARLGAECISISCLQKNEKKTFHTIKQWGTFGSGTSIVKRKVVEDLNFSMIFEHGFGEDMDFGMQIRNKGVDIIYHPGIEILHLKAPMGGFREKIVKEWEKKEPLPKPSPTVMAFALLHYTKEQIKGYKTSLFIKFYKRQRIKNPVAYRKQMELRWEQSEKWAKKLLSHSHSTMNSYSNE